MAPGSRIRFRQTIEVGLAVGEYTFTVGLATINHYDYERRSLYTHDELYSKIVRLCHPPQIGQFAVSFRSKSDRGQLLHHGVADLPGDCSIDIAAAADAILAAA